MNFLIKKFSKAKRETSEEMVNKFIDLLAESDNYFILSESLLSHGKSEIKRALDLKIEFQEKFIEQSKLDGLLDEEAQRQLERTKKLKLYVDDFVEIPERFEK